MSTAGGLPDSRDRSSRGSTDSLGPEGRRGEACRRRAGGGAGGWRAGVGPDVPTSRGGEGTKRGAWYESPLTGTACGDSTPHRRAGRAPGRYVPGTGPAGAGVTGLQRQRTRLLRSGRLLPGRRDRDTEQRGRLGAEAPRARVLRPVSVHPGDGPVVPGAGLARV